MKKYEVIIFDLDGTLSNSKPGITKSVQYALKCQGIIEDDLDNLNHFIGPPLFEEFKKSYNLTDEQVVKAVADYRERYIPVGIYETSIYPGTEEALKAIKKAGKYIAMATSKPQNLAEEVLRFLKIDQYFDNVKGADLNGPVKTKEQVLEKLFASIPDKNKSDFVLVGDTCFDVDGAGYVGIDCIGVSFGFGDINEMKDHGAIKIVDSMKELTEFLL